MALHSLAWPLTCTMPCLEMTSALHSTSCARSHARHTPDCQCHDRELLHMRLPQDSRPCTMSLPACRQCATLADGRVWWGGIQFSSFLGVAGTTAVAAVQTPIEPRAPGCSAVLANIPACCPTLTILADQLHPADCPQVAPQAFPILACLCTQTAANCSAAFALQGCLALQLRTAG